MNQRQEKLFKNIVQEHISQAKAIGSKFLADKYSLDISPATIRHDMVELESQGLIYQPHTSAGRIPTAKGYQYYVDNFLTSRKISSKEKQLLKNTWNLYKKNGSEIGVKNLAKKISELTKSAAIVAFSKDNVYYTGISNLLSQPEFADFDTIYNIGAVVDHLDEVLEDIFEQVKDTEIKIGDQNCFSNRCSSILTKKENKLFGILGPIRMDYEKNLGLVNYSRELIS